MVTRLGGLAHSVNRHYQVPHMRQALRRSRDILGNSTDSLAMPFGYHDNLKKYRFVSSLRRDNKSSRGQTIRLMVKCRSR